MHEILKLFNWDHNIHTKIKNKSDQEIRGIETKKIRYIAHSLFDNDSMV